MNENNKNVFEFFAILYVRLIKMNLQGNLALNYSNNEINCVSMLLFVKSSKFNILVL